MTPSEDAPSSRSDAAKQQLLQSTIRVILALAVLVAIQFVIVRVPVVERVVVDPDITIATIVYSLLSIAMFGAVISYATSVGAALSRLFESFQAVERTVQLLGVIVVLVWAYQVFWWLPYFRQNPAQYDYAFLMLGLLFVGWLGYTLYTNVDDLSAALAGQVIDDPEPEQSPDTDPGSEADSGSQPEFDPGGEATGDSAPDDTADPEPTASRRDTCPECGSGHDTDASFCPSCGAELTRSV